MISVPRAVFADVFLDYVNRVRCKRALVYPSAVTRATAKEIVAVVNVILDSCVLKYGHSVFYLGGKNLVNVFSVKAASLCRLPLYEIVAASVRRFKDSCKVKKTFTPVYRAIAVFVDVDAIAVVSVKPQPIIGVSLAITVYKHGTARICYSRSKL